jgi:hypothetical protein
MRFCFVHDQLLGVAHRQQPMQPAYGKRNACHKINAVRDQPIGVIRKKLSAVKLSSNDDVNATLFDSVMNLNSLLFL